MTKADWTTLVAPLCVAAAVQMLMGLALPCVLPRADADGSTAAHVAEEERDAEDIAFLDLDQVAAETAARCTDGPDEAEVRRRD